MSTFVYRNGELVPKEWAPPLRRSTLPAPAVHSDCVDHEFVPALGKRYTSKREIRRDARAAGLREIGTDLEGAVKDSFARGPTKPPVGRAVIEAYKKVKEGYKPPPLQTDAELGW